MPKTLTVKYSGLTFTARDLGTGTLFLIPFEVLCTMRVQIRTINRTKIYFTFVDDNAITRQGICEHNPAGI